MAANIGSIFVNLTADARPLTSALNLAGTSMLSTERAMGKSLVRLDRGFDRTFARATMGTTAFTGFARGAALALAPLITLNAVIGGTAASLDRFSAIFDQARAGGVGTDFFQALAFQAEQGGAKVEEMAAALASFAKNAGLAAQGKGRMLSALKALNPELLRAILATTSQEERVRLAADAIDRASSASEKAALSTTLFGDAGARLVEVFRGGSTAMAETAAKARELGIVISAQTINRAEELGDEFATATKIMDLEFKQVLVELAPLLVGTAQAVAGAARGIRDLWRAVGESPGMERLAARTAPLESRALSIMQEQLSRKQALLSGDGWLWDRAALEREVAALEAAIAARTSPEHFNIDATFELLAGLPKIDIFGGGEGLVDEEAADEILQQAEAVRELIVELEHERSLIGMSATEQRVANELRRAGVVATEKQRARIAELVTEIESEREALDRLNEQLDVAKGFAKDFLGGLVDDLQNGVSAAEALANAFGRLGDRLVDMALDQAIQWLFEMLLSSMGGSMGMPKILGKGGGSKSLSKVFEFHGGGRVGSGGTPRRMPLGMWANAPRLHDGSLGAGLRADEMPAILKKGEIVDPGDGSVFGQMFGTEVNNWKIDARGAQIGVAEQIRAALEHYDRHRVTKRIKNVMKDPYAAG